VRGMVGLTTLSRVDGHNKLNPSPPAKTPSSPTTTLVVEHATSGWTGGAAADRGEARAGFHFLNVEKQP
jgi:hypothetical protein